MQKLQMWRLIADEGKILVNGARQGIVIDVAPGSDPDEWSEVDTPSDQIVEGEDIVIEEQ